MYSTLDDEVLLGGVVAIHDDVIPSSRSHVCVGKLVEEGHFVGVDGGNVTIDDGVGVDRAGDGRVQSRRRRSVVVVVDVIASRVPSRVVAAPSPPVVGSSTPSSSSSSSSSVDDECRSWSGSRDVLGDDPGSGRRCRTGDISDCSDNGF